MPSSEPPRPGVLRQGPFWEILEGRRDPPPAAKLFGWEVVAVDPDAGTIEVSLIATDQFLNLAGDVQGGMVAAMLDATLGPALATRLGEGERAPNIDLHVQFLKPAKPGKFRGHGRVVRRGRDIAFVAGELRNEHGEVVATATASTIIRRGEPARP